MGNVQKRYEVVARFIRDIPTNVRIIFNSVSKDIEGVALLELDFRIGRKIQFRNMEVLKE